MHTVLLIDDTEDLAQGFRTLFKRFGVTNPFVTVNSQEEARKFLMQTGRRRNSEQKAGVVLINMHLPECQGVSFLHWMKSEKTLENVLRIALVERTRLKEAVRAYELGSHTFLVKPPSPEDLKIVFQSFPAWWTLSPPLSS